MYFFTACKWHCDHTESAEVPLSQLTLSEEVEDFFLFLRLLNPGTWSRDGTWMEQLNFRLTPCPSFRETVNVGAAKAVDTRTTRSNEDPSALPFRPSKLRVSTSLFEGT